MLDEAQYMLDILRNEKPLFYDPAKRALRDLLRASGRGGVAEAAADALGPGLLVVDTG
jgi:hypothetical protein